MKTLLKTGITCFLLLSAAIVQRLCPENNASVALITKIVQVVDRKPGQDEWIKAETSDLLNSGDGVRTGLRSLAIVKFIDNSIVRVRPQSEVAILGETNTPGSLSKNVRLLRGAFGFDVRKQHANERFQLTSPTSVASIRGTKGKLSGSDGNDTLIVTEGLVAFRNVPSDKSVDIPAGYIGFSGRDGSLTSRKATDEELADANYAATGGSVNELNLELKDSHGNKKELKLKFK
jgi:hypothetical protein